MNVLSLSLVFPILAPAAVIAAVFIRMGYDRAQRLSDRLQAEYNDQHKEELRCITETDRKDLVADPIKSEMAIRLLLRFEQIASSVSSTPAHWDHALAHNEHQLLRSALEQSSLLIQIVRRTNWPVETKAWNGSRRRAFRALLRACRVSLPVNA
jgi:hypothetical protein